MTVHLTVSTHMKNRPFFEKTYTEKEWERLSLGLNKDRSSCKVTMLYPRRTDTLAHFCEDLFFPHFFSELIKKTNSIFSKIFTCFAALYLDVLTFSPRLILALPRYLYNLSHTKADDVFYKYLAAQKEVDPKVHLAQDYVYVIRQEVDLIPGRTREISAPVYFSQTTGPVSDGWSTGNLRSYSNFGTETLPKLQESLTST